MNADTEKKAVVLVVDDNEDNRLIASANLEMGGYTILEAEHGERCLEVLAETPVDLVLLDIMMPGIDGYEVCRRIRADEALDGIKVLMLTAKAGTRDLVKGFEVGADDYVSKPFEIDELLARVGNLVNLKHAQDELRRLNADLEGEVVKRALELAQSEARYRTIFNAVPTSIMLLDTHGHITAVNAWHEAHPLFTQLYPQPLLNTQLAEHPGAQATGITERVTELLSGYGFEHQAHTGHDAAQEGDAVVRVRGVPITHEDGTVEGALILHEDLTEERQLQEQLLEAQKLASLGTLAQGIAHNFNNLLFVVSGSLEILRTGIDTDRCGKPLEQSKLALSRMAALTRQLASFSRLGEEGRHPVNVAQLVKDVADAFDPQLPEGVRIETEAPGNLPLISGCPGELYQAFHELIQNAIEAMPDGGDIRLVVREQLHALPNVGGTRAPEQPCVVVEINDTGIGMDEEAQRRVFEPFYTSKQTVGVGLGLSATHGVVRSHGGSVNIASAPGQGTCITVVLPMNDTRGAGATAPPETTQLSTKPVTHHD